jgi:hypothetical protein
VDLGGVEAHEPDVGVLVINLDRVGIQNKDISWIDGLCIGGYSKEQRGDPG